MSTHGHLKNIETKWEKKYPLIKSNENKKEDNADELENLSDSHNYNDKLCTEDVRENVERELKAFCKWMVHEMSEMHVERIRALKFCHEEYAEESKNSLEYLSALFMCVKKVEDMNLIEHVEEKVDDVLENQW